eukprot:COSAG05_NODE_1566_length_4539_cov_2.142342_3_plen_419_part_00
MSADDLIQRLEQAARQKQLGTEALQDGDTPTAQKRYEDALKLLRGSHAGHKAPGEVEVDSAEAGPAVLLTGSGGIDSPPPAGTGEQFRLLWAECARQGRQLELTCNLNLALCCLKRENWTQAIDAAGAAIQRDPKCAKAWFRRGIARAGHGQDEEAHEDLLRAARLAPNDKAIRRELKTVKERRRAQKRCEPAPSAAGTAAVAAALVSSGTLYKDVQEDENKPPLQRVEKILTRAHRDLAAGGRGAVEAALQACKTALQKIQQEENEALCIATAQRFMVHVLAAACHVRNCETASKLEACASAASRAVADLNKAESLLADGERQGEPWAELQGHDDTSATPRTLDDVLLLGTVAADAEPPPSADSTDAATGGSSGREAERTSSMRPELEQRLLEAQALAARYPASTGTVETAGSGGAA